MSNNHIAMHPLDGLNIDSLHDALIWMGICTPDSREMLAATAVEHVNDLTQAVLNEKAKTEKRYEAVWS